MPRAAPLAPRQATRGTRLRTPDGYQGHSRFLPYLLNRITSRINVGFQAELRRRRMTLTHWRILAFLVESDGLGVTALADKTDTDQSTLSRALMRLHKQGLVRREPGRADNRTVQVTLTRAGRAAFAAVLPIALGLRDAAIRGINAAELDSLAATLNKILANLEPDA